MIRQANSGKFSEAKSLHYKLLEFTRLIFEEGSPVGVKAALNKLKIVENNLRLPLVLASLELKEKIENWIDFNCQNNNC